MFWTWLSVVPGTGLGTSLPTIRDHGGGGGVCWGPRMLQRAGLQLSEALALGSPGQGHNSRAKYGIVQCGLVTCTFGEPARLGMFTHADSLLMEVSMHLPLTPWVMR